MIGRFLQFVKRISFIIIYIQYTDIFDYVILVYCFWAKQIVRF